MKHFDLCADLARVKNTIYIECPLGSVWGASFAKTHERAEAWRNGQNMNEFMATEQSPQRADVIKVRPSYTKFCIDIFECKVTRSDFLGDIRRNKWQGYLHYCNRFYFAVESGVATAAEVPDPAGLMIRGKRGWKVVKAARPREIEYDMEFMMAMLFYRQSTQQYRRSIFAQDDYKREKLVLKIFGKTVGRNIYNRVENAIHDERVRTGELPE